MAPGSDQGRRESEQALLGGKQYLKDKVECEMARMLVDPFPSFEKSE